jgi:hypothetical protein
MPEVILPEDLNFDTTKGWLVPVQVENSELYQEKCDSEHPGWLSFTGPWKRVSPGPDTLARFLALADASPRELLKFAKKYGPLGVRSVQIGGGEEVVGIWGDVTTYANHDGSRYYSELTHSEFNAFGTSMWRTRARRTKHLIEVAQKLHAGKTVNEADWRECKQWVIEGRFVVAFKKAHGLKLSAAATKDQLRQLSAQFKSWYREKERYRPPSDPWERVEDAVIALIGRNPLDLSMRFSVRKGKLSFSFATCLRDYLAVQTLHAIGYGSGAAMVMCANPECRAMFKPTHPIPEGKNAWCRKCGTKVAVRFAMRKMRTEEAKQKAAEKARAEHSDQSEVEI